MHQFGRALSTAYTPLVGQHDQLMRAPQPSSYAPVYHHNVSATQTLASLRDKARQLRENERSLKKQIDYYQTSLTNVQAALKITVNKANELQNVLAPISRLPNELLLAIFEEAVACQDQGIAEHAEFTISKVSRRWRELAIHSPRLWCRVCVTPRAAPRMLEIYKTRATRALDIEICGWRDRRDFQRFDAALEMMLDSSSRWRSLSIACVCDTHLSHLTLKLSHIGNISGLKHFTFRALRPGQTCSAPFLMGAATSAQPPLIACHAPSPCATLKSLDAENFTLTGDVASIHARAIQSFSRLTSLSLRRYNHDTRASRTTIDFGAFRAMLAGIPYLTTLMLYGQPLRFHSDPVGGLQHGLVHGTSIGAALGVAVGSTTVSLPQLHTLVLHPGVLKPRYLQQTISAIHAPALRHFELVFPDSKLSGQSVVEQLFVDALPPFSALSLAPTSNDALSSSASATKHTHRRRPRFPHVDTLVLNNASSASTAPAFIRAFPYTTQATLGGVDVGHFPQAFRSSALSAVDEDGTGMKASLGRGSGSRSGVSVRSGSGSGVSACDCQCSCAGAAYWHRLHTLRLRQPRQETLRVLVEWICTEYLQRHPIPTLIVEGSTELHQISRPYLECALSCTKVVAIETPSAAAMG